MKILARIAPVAYVVAAVFASASFSTVRADDTDIYVNNMPAPESVPLVMFSLDYRPNLGSTVCTNISSGCAAAEYFRQFPETAAWMDTIIPANGTLEYFDMLRLALHVVLQDITGVKVGLMMSHEHSNNCAGPNQSGCSNGGYIVKGLEQLQEGDANGALQRFTEKLFALPRPQGDVSHTYQGKEMFFEFFRYLTGQKVYNGYNNGEDFGGSPIAELALDSTIVHPSDKYYFSPLADASSCAQIFTINFYGGTVNQEDDSDNAITASKANGGMEGIDLSGKNNSFETVISYLRDVDLADGTYGTVGNIAGKQNVMSYFLTDGPVKADNDRAIAGGTQRALPLDQNPEALVKTLTDIFNEILSVSTTFVSASVPVNVFNRAESLDNVFIALFQAEETPVWPGNLKKLKIKVTDAGALLMYDALGNAAINGTDGRIKFDALTYWTDPNTLPAPREDTEEVAGRDGRVVDRGAAGQNIPGFVSNNLGLYNPAAGTEPALAGPRKVLYENGAGPLVALNADTTTADAVKAHFGADVTTDEAVDLIKWLRGIDPATDSARPWIMGDPLHSRPLPVSYGLRNGHTDKDNPLIYIAMGTNDGHMHFFRNTDSSGNELGKEVWTFVPTEIMDKIPRLKTNMAGEVPKHPYTVDGSPAAFLDDRNGDGSIAGEDESAYLYFGLRRGGKAYYALDITDPNSPELAWKITKTDGGDFDELGYTFSQPQVGYVDYNGDDVKDPVVIFAGGYDLNKDARDVAVGTDDTEGNAIYVVDARTGALIWKTVKGTSNGSLSEKVYTRSDMEDSIPSDITAVDTNADGMIDRLLYGDTGGRVWRTDVYSSRENWQTTLLASVGRHDQTGSTNDRRFFHKPDFVQAQMEVSETVDGVTTTSIVQFDAVIIGSGNRPNPLDQSYAVDAEPVNWLYMIRDQRLLPAKASPAPADVVEDLGYTHASFGDITDPVLGAPTNAGWKLELEVSAGEKALSTPLTINNTVYFTTYLPDGLPTDETTVTETTEDGVMIEPATCGPSEGSGLLYAVNLQSGRAANNYNTADDADGVASKEDRWKELASGGIPAEAVPIIMDNNIYVNPPDNKPAEDEASNRWRTFWYEVEDTTL